MKGIKITLHRFNKKTSSVLKKLHHGSNWPVVYIINDKNEVYIGETTDVSIRANQHYAKEERRKLNKITIIDDEEANKSSILDLESFLIKYMSADGKFKLQNSNKGLQNHNYFRRNIYTNKFKEIWQELKLMGLVEKELKDIYNSNLFKFSPYKSLENDQYDVINTLIEDLTKDAKKNLKTSFVINGGAGTGKTILAVYLAKLLISGIDSEDFKTENDLNVHNLREILKSNSVSKGEIKIAFVVSMSNFRTTLKSVFKGIKELSAGMVMSPSEVANSKDDFDILIIDEAHRLKRKNAVTQREHRSFRNHNKALGLGDDGTQLDWLIAKSKYQILFYDKGQTVRPADIPKDVFEELSAKEENHTYFLTTQKRCLLGGNKYINYVDAIFSENPPKEKISFKEYELKLFNNVDEMVNEIKSKDDEYGLCRNIAGFAWEWKTKNKLMPKTHQSKDKMKEIIDGGDYDIDIDGYKYIWNVADKDWINSPNAVNEIGSIHTSQGYDLNYTGLIIGNELKYDWVNKKLIIDRSEYKDIKGKTRVNDNELYGYVLNIYRTMMKRGCRGTYIYACDEGLREYLKQYIEEK